MQYRLLIPISGLSYYFLSTGPNHLYNANMDREQINKYFHLWWNKYVLYKTHGEYAEDEDEF